MANIEKHPKPTMEEIEGADGSRVPICARASHLIGHYIKNRREDGDGHLPENQGTPVILRLTDVPATPRNVERMRERVRLLNRRLAASGVPFRLRVV